MGSPPKIALALSWQPPPVQVVDFKDLFSLLALHPGEFFLDLTTDHVRDDLVECHIGKPHRRDILPVAHDGHAVDDVLQLLQPVGDVNDAAPVFLELVNDPEQVIDFARSERRCRLIHNQHPRVRGKRLGDFHHLLLGHRQIPYDLTRVDVDLEFIEHAGGFFFHFRIGKHKTVPLFPAQKHVFGHRQMAAHVQLLMDDRHADLLRLLGRQVAIRLAKDLHCARVAGVYAAEYFHQRGFARTIFPKQCHDFPCAQLKLHIVKRLHAGKALCNALHGNDDLIHPPFTHLSIVLTEIALLYLL